jgi:type IV secretory pathway TrbF-like protein
MRLPALLRSRASAPPGSPTSNGAQPAESGAPAGQVDGSAPNRIVANARREFAGVFGDLARGKRNWQVIAFALAAILGIETVGMVRLAFTAQVVPYVVHVDQLGQVTAAGLAEPLRDPDARLVASQLADFIRSVRTVLPSAAWDAQTKMLRHGYAFAAPEAAGFLNSYFGEAPHDPRLLATRLTREVEVTSALMVPDVSRSAVKVESPEQTWRLQWIETDRPTQPGDTMQVTAWEGYLTVRVEPPTTAEVVQENPLGLYVTSIAWTRVGRRTTPDSASEGGYPR